MSLTVTHPQYIQDTGPWWGPLATSILVPMVNGALERQRQRDENRKHNAYADEVRRRMEEYMAAGNAPLAAPTVPEGYYANPWARAAHQNNNPLAQFDANTVDLLPPTTQGQQTVQRVPTTADWQKIMTEVGATDRFAPWINSETMQKIMQPYLAANEAARIEAIRQGYADRYRDTSNPMDRSSITTEGAIAGYLPESIANMVRGHAEKDRPQFSPVNTGGEYVLGSVDPTTGMYNEQGRIPMTLTPGQAQVAKQWQTTFDRNNQLADRDFAYKQQMDDRDYELKKQEIDARYNGQISPMDKARADFFADRMRYTQNSINTLLNQRRQLLETDPQVKLIYQEIAKLQEQLQSDRNEIGKILGVEQGNTQSSEVMPPVPPEYRPQGTGNVQANNNNFGRKFDIFLGNPMKSLTDALGVTSAQLPSQAQSVAQTNGGFGDTIAGLFSATPAYADEVSNGTGETPAYTVPQQNNTISTPHNVGGLIANNNSLTVTTPFHKQRTRENGSTYYHDAVDYALPNGSELRVPDYGVPFTVSGVRNDPEGYGNYVDLTANVNGHKVDLRLAHLQDDGLKVKTGQTLNPGDLIGLSGNSGNSRGKNGGYHLHLETKADGQAVDPRNFKLETNSTNLLAGNNAPEITGTIFNGEELPVLSPNGVLGASLTPMGLSGGAPKRKGYTSYAKQKSVIDRASQKYGIDNELIQAIIEAESAWNPNSRSKAGAMVLMQLMPGTARAMGVRDAYDPAQNIEGGSKYIAQLVNRYGGDISKALMAYNCGPGNVKRGRIPKRSRAYAKKVMGIYNGLKGQRSAPTVQPPSTQTTVAPALQQQRAPDGSGISWVNSDNQPMLSASGEPFTDELYSR